VENLWGQRITFNVEKPKEDGSWKTNVHDFEAALSFLQYACRGKDEEKSAQPGACQNMHILGADTPLLRRDLRWWSQGQSTRIKVVKEVKIRKA
jgi:hypothetical protein